MRFYAWKEAPKGRRRNWEVVWQQPPHGKRQRRAVEGGEAEAAKLVAAAKAELAAGRPWHPPDAPRTPGLGEMLHAFLDDVERAYKPSTLKRYASDLSLFVQYLEAATGRPESALRGADLTSTMMRGYWDWLCSPGTGASSAGRRGETTSRKALNTAYAFAEWAAGQDEFRDHVRVPGRFKLPPVTRPRKGAPTWQQMALCVQAVQAPWMRRAAVLLYYTGLRVNLQVMQLRWEDFDLDAGTVRIARPELCKTAHELSLQRVMPVSPHLLEELRGWAEWDGVGGEGPTGWVVPLEQDPRGRPKEARELRGRDMKRAWIRALGRYPDDWGRPNHCFRAGWNTALRLAGVDKEVREYMLGHKSSAVVDFNYTDEVRAYQAEMERAVRAIPSVEEAARGAAGGEGAAGAASGLGEVVQRLGEGRELSAEERAEVVALLEGVLAKVRG